GTIAPFTLNTQSSTVELSQPLGNGQPQPEALLLMQLALKLHVSTHACNVLSGETSAAIAYRQGGPVGRLSETHGHGRARFGELERILRQLVHDSGQVILGNRDRYVAQLKN